MNNAEAAVWIYMMLFGMVCTILLVLPFVPAWREWRQPSDSAALKISLKLTSDTAFLAEQFREHIQGRLTAVDPKGYALLGTNLVTAGPALQPGHLPVVSTQAIRSRVDAAFLCPLYVTDDLSLTGRANLREVLCLGALTLGPRSQVSGWAHSDKEAVMGEGSTLVRRVSSAVSIDLARHCGFERLHAPTLRFSQTALPAIARMPVHSQPFWHRLRRVPGAQQWGEGTWRIDGDCDIPAWHQFTGSLVVMGVLHVGEGALVEGSVKARKGIHVGAGARVTGAAVSAEGIHLMPDAVVGGPLVSETHVLLHTRARVGAPDAPTTVSATDILIDRGVTAHGTVWARDAGIVLGIA